MSNTYNMLLAKETQLRSQIKKTEVGSVIWKVLWNKLDNILMRKKAYSQSIVNQCNRIYANWSKRFPVGYIDWYEKHYTNVTLGMYGGDLDIESFNKLVDYLDRKKFHFAAYTAKQHPTSVVEDILCQMLYHFIAKQSERFMKQLKNEAIQLEFKFKYN